MLPNDYEKIKGVASVGGAKTGKLYVDQGGGKKSVMTIKNSDGDILFDKCAWLIQDGYVRDIPYLYYRAYAGKATDFNYVKVPRETAKSKTFTNGSWFDKDIGYLAFKSNYSEIPNYKSMYSSVSTFTFDLSRGDFMDFDNSFIDGETFCALAEVYNGESLTEDLSNAKCTSGKVQTSSRFRIANAKVQSSQTLSTWDSVNEPPYINTDAFKTDRRLYLIGASMVFDDGEFKGYTENLPAKTVYSGANGLRLQEGTKANFYGTVFNNTGTTAKGVTVNFNVINFCLIPTRLLPQMVERLGWSGLEQHIAAEHLSTEDNDAINALYE